MSTIPLLHSLARPVGALGLCAALLMSPPARAQGIDSQKALAAQALYDQASTEMDARDFASACPKLEEVTRLVPEGIGARLTLGECYEALGKLASAWSQYALVQTMAARAGQPERSQKAATRAAALKPRLATLAIHLPDTVRTIPGLSITRDGLPMGQTQWETPLPVDIGPHEVVVAAPGYKTWKRTVEVVADGAAVRLEVKPLTIDDTATPQSGLVPLVLPALPPADRSWQRPAGITAIVTGNAALVSGLLLGVIAMTKKEESNQPGRCDARNTCDETGLALRSQAVGLGNTSTGLVIAGAAVLAGGIALFATAPPRREEKKTPKETPGDKIAARVGVSPGGAWIAGTW